MVRVHIDLYMYLHYRIVGTLKMSVMFMTIASFSSLGNLVAEMKTCIYVYFILMKSIFMRELMPGIFVVENAPA